MMRTAMMIGLMTLTGQTALAQSSSLYVTQGGGQEQASQVLDHRQLRQQTRGGEPRAQARTQQDERMARLEALEQRPALERRVKGRVVHSQLQATSFTAVNLPEPRHFAEEDLITIIIREQTQASSEQSKTTNNDFRINSELEAIPRLQLKDLLEGQLKASDEEDLPEFGLRNRNEWEGEGDYSRRDTMTTRLTARVIDVKPNGTLALEARTYIRTDGEEQEIKVTGYCRSDDIAGDNTVLSTQMFDLRIEREHAGDLRNASEKGVLTRIIDTVFNF